MENLKVRIGAIALAGSLLIAGAYYTLTKNASNVRASQQAFVNAMENLEEGTIILVERVPVRNKVTSVTRFSDIIVENPSANSTNDSSNGQQCLYSTEIDNLPSFEEHLIESGSVAMPYTGDSAWGYANSDFNSVFIFDEDSYARTRK